MDGLCLNTGKCCSKRCGDGCAQLDAIGPKNQVPLLRHYTRIHPSAGRGRQLHTTKNIPTKFGYDLFPSNDSILPPNIVHMPEALVNELLGFPFPKTFLS